MKITHLRPRSDKAVREYDSTDQIPAGQFGSVSGTVYVRLIDGTLLTVTTAEPE